MASQPKELHKDLVSPRIAAPVVLIPLTFDVAETADVTIAAFVAHRRMKIIKASYIQESNATAATTYTCKLANGATDITDALDIKTLGADAAADFAGIDSNDDTDLDDGDILDVVFNETGGTVTAPDRVGILIEALLLE